MLVEAPIENQVACNAGSLDSLSIAAQYGHQEVYEYLLPLISDPEEREYAQKELPKGVIRKQRRENKQLLLNAGATNGYFVRLFA